MNDKGFIIFLVLERVKSIFKNIQTIIYNLKILNLWDVIIYFLRSTPVCLPSKKINIFHKWLKYYTTLCTL